MTLTHRHQLAFIGVIVASALAFAILLLSNAAAQCIPMDLNCMNLP